MAKILLIDDDIDLIKILSFNSNNSGYQTPFSTNTKNVLKNIKELINY